MVAFAFGHLGYLIYECDCLFKIFKFEFVLNFFIINYYPYQISFIIAALFTLLYPLLNKAENDDINNLPNP